MPIDTSFLRNAAPAQVPSPYEAYQKSLTLRELIDRRRQNEELRAHQRVQWQQAEEDRQRKMSLIDLLRRNPNATEEEILKTDPITGMPLIKERNDQKQVQRQAEEAHLRGEKVKEEILKAKRVWHANLAGSLLQEKDPEKRTESFNRYTGGMVETDLLSPEEASEHMGDEATIWQVVERGLGMEGLQDLRDKIAEAARKEAEEAHKAALRPAAKRTAEAGATKAEQEVTGTQPMTAYQTAQIERQKMPNMPTEILWWLNQPGRTSEERVQGQKILKELVGFEVSKRPQTTVNLPGYGSQASPLTGDEFLKTLNPGIQSQVRGIAEGRIVMPPASSRAPGAQQLRTAVMQYDPTFSEQRAQVRKAFTTGPEGKNIGALNTAIVHLGRLAHAGEALENGTFGPTNEMYQYLRDKFGSATVTNFSLLKDAVAGEMAAALKGNATDIEIANMKTSIRASNSPAQMLGVVKEGMGILSDKAKTYDERYHREMKDDPWSPILPSATEMLTRFGTPYKKTGPTPTVGPRKAKVWNPTAGRFE